MEIERKERRMIKKKENKILAFATILLVGANAAPGQSSSAQPTVTASRAFQLTGYTQILYKHDWTSGSDGFQVRRARLGLSGEIAKNINFKFLFEGAKTPYLIDAQVEVAFSKKLTLRFGQFKVPFSLESYTSTSDLDTVNRSQVVDKLSPGRDIGASGRDIGAMVCVKYSIAEVNVGLLNGSGINKADTDKHKDVVSRVVLAPLAWLQVGASVYDGEVTTSSGPARRDRTGLDVALSRGDFSFKGEYIAATDARITTNGWYAQAGYFIVPKKVQAILKFDSFDKNRDAGSDRSDVLTVGVNWFFTSKTKLQINYERIRLETGKVLGNSLLVQFQAGF